MYEKDSQELPGKKGGALCMACMHACSSFALEEHTGSLLHSEKLRGFMLMQASPWWQTNGAPS